MISGRPSGLIQEELSLGIHNLEKTDTEKLKCAMSSPSMIFISTIIASAVFKV